MMAARLLTKRTAEAQAVSALKHKMMKKRGGGGVNHHLAEPRCDAARKDTSKGQVGENRPEIGQEQLEGGQHCFHSLQGTPSLSGRESSHMTHCERQREKMSDYLTFASGMPSY